MRILHVIDIPWHSAVTAYAMELSKGLHSRGHKLFFAGASGGLPLKLAGAQGFVTLEIPSRKNPLFFLGAIGIRNFIGRENIDLVHVHTGKTQFLAYLGALSCKKKFPVIRTKSDARPPKKSFMHDRVHKIIAGSEFIRRKYLELGVAPSKVVTVRQGIKEPPTAPCMQAGPRPDRGIVNVGILARLDPVKGHEYFLESARLVLEKKRDVRFLIAGKEANIRYERLKRRARDLGIAGSVECFGYVDNAFNFIRKCAVGVIASTGSEAISRVCLEWMACAKAVVATDVGCIPEILGREFIVPPSAPEPMANKILELLEDRDKLCRAGADNKDLVKKRYNFDDFITQIENIYNEAIKGVAQTGLQAGEP